MKKSIEISGRTLSYLIGTILLMSGLIFTINQYDNKKKIEKIKITLNEFATFDSQEIQSVLLNGNLNSLTVLDIERIQQNLSRLDNKEALKNISRYNSQILVKEGSDFYKLEYRELGYYGRSVSDPENIVKYTVLSQKQHDLVHSLEGENIDVNEVILDHFSFMDFPKIIYPLGANENRKIYFSFSYSEDK